VSRQKYNKKNGIVTSIVVSLILIAITYLLIYNKQFIIDQVTVWQYSANSEIVGITNRTGMSENGKFIFYASQPIIDSTNRINSLCNRIENTTSILGCYSNNRIYIYNVTDEQLDGVREVTATHEMLHAVYVRMGDDEKATVDKLLETEYNKLVGNKEFADLIAYYGRSEPGQRSNELHSIIGTEITNISPELESHYNKYFSNRQKVVELNAKYSGVFKILKGKADALNTQIDGLFEIITASKAQYESDTSALSADISSFNTRAVSQGFTSQTQFNLERSVLVNRTTALDEMRNNISKDITKYNLLVVEHDAIATESNKLLKSMDSSLAPAPSI
jgi:hypothetical protein